MLPNPLYCQLCKMLFELQTESTACMVCSFEFHLHRIPCYIHKQQYQRWYFLHMDLKLLHHLHKFCMQHSPIHFHRTLLCMCIQQYQSCCQRHKVALSSNFGGIACMEYMLCRFHKTLNYRHTQQYPPYFLQHN